MIRADMAAAAPDLDPDVVVSLLTGAHCGELVRRGCVAGTFVERCVDLPWAAIARWPDRPRHPSIDRCAMPGIQNRNATSSVAIIALFHRTECGRRETNAFVSQKEASMNTVAVDHRRTEPTEALHSVSRYRHPVAFYTLATAIPWALWFTAAWLSHRPDPQLGVIAGLGLAGLVASMLVAFWFIRRDGLTRDVLARLVAPPGASAWLWAVAVFLLPASLLVATAISIPFGYDISQFKLQDGFSFAAGPLPAWIVLALAPLLEELAWKTYGTDALASRMNILWTSLVFGVVWVLWHLPLGFIKGYYQAEVVEEGWIHSVNYAVSLIPFLILMNWLYYRGGRSVLLAIVFHLAANFGNELFQTDPDTKVIQTGLLLVLSVALVWHDRKLFMTPPARRQ